MRRRYPRGGGEGKNRVQDKPLPPESSQEKAWEEQRENPDGEDSFDTDDEGGPGSPVDAASVLTAGASHQPKQEPSAPREAPPSKARLPPPRQPPLYTSGAPGNYVLWKSDFLVFANTNSIISDFARLCAGVKTLSLPSFQTKFQ